jgi:N-methylhydantoinase A
MNDMEVSDIEEIFNSLMQRAREKLDELKDLQVRIDRSLELRYVGQSFEINVTLPEHSDDAINKSSIIETFHKLHEELYGYSDIAEPVELVNARISAFAINPKPSLVRRESHTRKEIGIQTADILSPVEKVRETYAITHRADMNPGDRFEGPCLILSQNSTALVPKGWIGTMDEDGTIQLKKGEAS